MDCSSYASEKCLLPAKYMGRWQFVKSVPPTSQNIRYMCVFSSLNEISPKLSSALGCQSYTAHWCFPCTIPTVSAENGLRQQKYNSNTLASAQKKNHTPFSKKAVFPVSFMVCACRWLVRKGRRRLAVTKAQQLSLRGQGTAVAGCGQPISSPLPAH